MDEECILLLLRGAWLESSPAALLHQQQWQTSQRTLPLAAFALRQLPTVGPGSASQQTAQIGAYLEEAGRLRLSDFPLCLVHLRPGSTPWLLQFQLRLDQLFDRRLEHLASLCRRQGM